MNKLELFYPVKPYFRYQQFGASDACTENRDDIPVLQRKVVSKVVGTCPVGYIELYPLLGMKGHTGADLAAGRGVAVRASHDGIVREVCLEAERGLGVGIVTNDLRDMGTHGTHHAKTRYWHLLSVTVQIGQEVKCGDVLGYADSTGLSSGDHLHFELKPVEYLSDGFNYENVFQSNGYFGAVDPEQFWNGMAASDYQNITAKIKAIVLALKALMLALTK